MDKNEQTSFITSILDPEVTDRENEHPDIPDIDELVARIDEMIEDLKDDGSNISVEEERIVDRIRKTLKNHDLRYIYNPLAPNMVMVKFSLENKPFTLTILVTDDKVIMTSSFPFRIQSSCLALITLYMVRFNADKAFARMNLNMEEGEILLEYSYLLSESKDFDEEYFWTYVCSFIKPSLDAYSGLQRMAIGMVSEDRKRLYKPLLERSLAVLNGDEEDERTIEYGFSCKGGNDYDQE
ncbi:MAG: hypothetical protein K6E34_07135 [Lachnospiraceae bacterium]|nr:hypothetical protein [Lachnospiraceae bacterium]